MMGTLIAVDMDGKTQASGERRAARERELKMSDWAPPISTANPSGLIPLAFKLVVLPDPVEEVTKGGIIRPVDTVTKDEFATTAGTIVALASAAFSNLTDEDWGNDKPQVGDHIVYTRYAGFRRKGADGVEYLIIKDEDVHTKIAKE